jgi:hypothetical protein
MRHAPPPLRSAGAIFVFEHFDSLVERAAEDRSAAHFSCAGIAPGGVLSEDIGDGARIEIPKGRERISEPLLEEHAIESPHPGGENRWRGQIGTHRVIPGLEQRECRGGFRVGLRQSQHHRQQLPGHLRVHVGGNLCGRIERLLAAGIQQSRNPVGAIGIRPSEADKLGIGIANDLVVGGDETAGRRIHRLGRRVKGDKPATTCCPRLCENDILAGFDGKDFASGFERKRTVGGEVAVPVPADHTPQQ